MFSQAQLHSAKLSTEQTLILCRLEEEIWSSTCCNQGNPGSAGLPLAVDHASLNLAFLAPM